MWRTFYHTDPTTCLRIFTKYWVTIWKPVIATAIPAACIGTGLLMFPPVAVLPIPPIPPAAIPLYAQPSIPFTGLGQPYGGGGYGNGNSGGGEGFGGGGSGGFGGGGGGNNNFIPFTVSPTIVPLFIDVFLPVTPTTPIPPTTDVVEPKYLTIFGLAITLLFMIRRRERKI